MMAFNPSIENPSRTSPSASTHLPPKVDITVERLDGIIWSTNKNLESNDEVKKHVPFITATVEFAGTCPNMKVYSASKYAHTKNPAVESFFASLAQDPSDSQTTQNEVKKIISTTTQGAEGTTTTTTTTTITTSAASPTKLQDGHYPLVANWQDDSNQEKLVDSITYFTRPRTCEETESKASSLSEKGNRPHLSLTLPTVAEQQRPSFLTAMLSPCHRHQGKWGDSSTDKKTGKKTKSGGSLVGIKTGSTAASTSCSAASHIHDLEPLEPMVPHALVRNIRQNDSSPLLDFESLLDKESDDEDDTGDDKKEGEQLNGIQQTVTRQDEATVAPVFATKRSKELAATVIAAESSSATVGQAETQSGAFAPLSWMACGTPSPEIVELRVRIMPEDSDELDEVAPSSQHLAASRNLEGVAHLVFLDQIVEEGTTVMDLPLKIVHEPKPLTRDQTILSTTPAVGEQEYVTLGADAMLRVRVTILPQGRRHINNAAPAAAHQTLYENGTMRTQTLPEDGLPHYSVPLSLQSQMLPLIEKLKHIQLPYFGGNEEKATGKATEDETNPQSHQNQGSFPHGFPTVVPDDSDSNKVESFLGEWKSYGESWGWLKALSALTRRTSSGDLEEEDRKRSETRKEKKTFYTIPNAPRSSSTITNLISGDSDTDVFLLI